MIDPEDDLMQAPSAVQPVLISSLAHCLLQGIIFCQLVSFGQRQASDSLRLKIFVYTIFTLCFVQTIHQIYKVWTVTISQENWAISPARYIEFPLNSVICTAVQAFLVRRVWKVTGRRWLVLIPLVILLLATFAAGLTLSITFKRFIQNPALNARNCHGIRECIPEFSAWLWGSAILDATITVTLSIYFVRSKTGFHHLDAVVTRILNLTLLTAALPMTSMLAAVSLFYATGGKHYHTVTALTVISSKLYFNGLLRNLNVRDKLKASMQANTMGRRSIVTVGSTTPLNKRPKSTAIEEDTLTDDITILHDVEKAAVPVTEGYREDVAQSPQIDGLYVDVERGDLEVYPSHTSSAEITPSRAGSWPHGQIDRWYRIVTL